jgi:hypothetical protein
MTDTHFCAATFAKPISHNQPSWRRRTSTQTRLLRFSTQTSRLRMELAKHDKFYAISITIPSACVDS